MIPVLFQFTFTTPLAQGVLYLLALALIAYAAFAGWRGAATPKDRTTRAIIFAVIGAVVARFGLYYALPAGAFLGAKGEGIPIHTYGVMLATGFIMAVTIAGVLAQREWRGEEGLRKRDQIMDLAFYVLVGGIVGSRVLFIIVNWKDYAANPSQMFSLGGGLVFQGGLIGATLAAYVFTRIHKIDFLRLADVALPTVALGSAFGRLGCFSAGCCWGDPAGEASAIGVHFPGAGIAKNLFGQLSNTSSLAYSSMRDGSGAGTGHRWVLPATGETFDAPVDGAVRIADWVAQHGQTLSIYPTQLMDSLGNVLFFLLLLAARRYRRFHGQVLGFYLMGYAVLRSSVEMFRGDAERGTLHGIFNAIPVNAWYNISTGQFISLCMFTVGAAFLVHKGRQVLAQERVATPAGA